METASKLVWRTRTMNLEFDEDEGIIFVRRVDDFTGPETLEHAQENIAQLPIFMDRLRGAILHMPDHYLTASVTRYYGKNTPNIPVGVVANNRFRKILGNFILGLANTARPMKMFDQEEEALSWVMGKL